MNASSLIRRCPGAGLTFGESPLPTEAERAPRNAGQHIPDHAAFWSGLPLPVTPAQAWRGLDAATQAEIGAAVIGMALAEYISGDVHDEADQFLDEALRERAGEVEHDLLQRIGPRVWRLFPELFGPEREHPAWALAGGFAR